MSREADAVEVSLHLTKKANLPQLADYVDEIYIDPQYLGTVHNQGSVASRQYY